MFDAGYVALMPGIRWLPSPGANLDGVGEDATSLSRRSPWRCRPSGRGTRAPDEPRQRSVPDGAVWVALIASDFVAARAG